MIVNESVVQSQSTYCRMFLQTLPIEHQCHAYILMMSHLNGSKHDVECNFSFFLYLVRKLRNISWLDFRGDPPCS
jgi:hypothetical protein